MKEKGPGVRAVITGGREPAAAHKEGERREAAATAKEGSGAASREAGVSGAGEKPGHSVPLGQGAQPPGAAYSPSAQPAQPKPLADTER